jgi:predicted RNase H-like nuclease
MRNGAGMAVVAGIDGCRGGWLMVRRDPESGRTDFVIFESWAELPAADMIAVDMPIGLPESGGRGCDRLARKLLGKRRSSVFLGLRRPLLDFADYPSANEWAKSDGAGLSKQAWFLLGKIREIDQAIEPADQARIRETHPELAFLALKGGPLEHPKKTPAGQAERVELLEAAGFGRVEPWLDLLAGAPALPDDLLDACALSLAAERMLKGEGRRLPDDPPRDARGLSMEIWY